METKFNKMVNTYNKKRSVLCEVRDNIKKDIALIKSNMMEAVIWDRDSKYYFNSVRKDANGWKDSDLIQYKIDHNVDETLKSLNKEYNKILSRIKKLDTTYGLPDLQVRRYKSNAQAFM